MIKGCKEDDSGICYGSHEEEAVIEKTYVDEYLCSCGKECSTSCYDADLKVKYDNQSCVVTAGTYNSYHEANNKIKKYSINSTVDIIVRNENCYFPSDTKRIVKLGIIFFLISSFFCISILLFCIFYLYIERKSRGKKEKNKNMTENLI